MQAAKIFVIPGQGSHYFHMGEWFYRRDLVFKKTASALNDYMKKNYNRDILHSIYNPNKKTGDWLSDIRITHPGIFIIHYALGRMLLSQGVKPDYIVGISLGELVGLCLLDVISEESCLDLLMKQAQFLKSFNKSSMLIWLQNNIHHEDIEKHQVYLSGKLSPKCCILACHNDKLDQINYLRSQGETIETLMVDYGFHSPLVDLEPFQEVLARFSKNIPRHVMKYYSATSQERLLSNHFWQVSQNAFDLPKTLAVISENLKNAVFYDISFTGSLPSLLVQNNVVCPCICFGSRFNPDGPFLATLRR